MRARRILLQGGYRLNPPEKSIPVKAALAELGLVAGKDRLPKPETLERIRTVLAAVEVWRKIHIL